MHYLGNGDVLLHDLLDLDDVGDLLVLHHDVRDTLRNSDYLLLENGHFHLAFDNFLDLLDESNHLLLHLHDLLDFNNRNKFLLDDLDLHDLDGLTTHSHNLLNNLWHLHNPLHCILNHNDFFYKPFNFLHYSIERQITFPDDLELGNLYDFLNYPFNFDYSGNLNYLFDYFFNVDRDLYNLLNDLFDRDKLLHFDSYLFDFRHGVVYYFLNFDDFSHGDVLHHNLLDLDDARNLYNFLDDAFRDLRNFHNTLNYALDLHNFLDFTVDKFDDLNWYVHDLLDFLNLGYFDNLIDCFFNNDHLWHFNHPFHDLLHNLFDLNNLGDNSEGPEDILDLHNSSHFLPDHRQQALGNFQPHSWDLRNFLKLDQQCLN